MTPGVAVQVQGQRAWYRTFASAGSEVRDFGSAQAVLTQARGERSLLNAVVYDDPADVRLDELAAFFAPVESWCVWVQPRDDALADACGARGLTIGGTPTLMAAALADVDTEPRVVPAEIDERIDLAALGSVNDAAYGLPVEHFAPILRRLSPDGYRMAFARRDGEALACAAAHVQAGNAEVVFVATLPDARRQGLAAECLRTVLRTAAAEGCATTTLEATAAGAPVYAAMGYASLGTYRMLEARRA